MGLGLPTGAGAKMHVLGEVFGAGLAQEAPGCTQRLVECNTYHSLHLAGPGINAGPTSALSPLGQEAHPSPQPV